MGCVLVISNEMHPVFFICLFGLKKGEKVRSRVYFDKNLGLLSWFYSKL